MAGKIGIGAVDHRLVEARPRDARLEIVAHRLPGRAAKKGKCANVRRYPVRQALSEGRLGIGVVRSAEHGDKDLGRDHFAGEPIDHLHGVARIVDEELLASDMNLAQRRLQTAGPFLVAFTKPRIAEAVGRRVAVLLPQQHQRHVWSAQFAMNERPIRMRTFIAGQIGGRRIKPVLKPDIVIKLRWQRPSQPGAARSVQVLAHRSLSQAKAAGNGALGHADAVV